MTCFFDQCTRLEVALGAAYDPARDVIDRCMWPGMPEHCRGYTWVIKRNGKYIVLGENFDAALASATRMGQRRVS